MIAALRATAAGLALTAMCIAAANGAAREDQWPTYGRTPDNQRYSPLRQIHRGNVGELRPVWTQSLGTLDGLEATPLVVDDVLYVSSAWAHVYAYDAHNGRRLWHYAPQYPNGFGNALCCGPVHRGVAVQGGLVYVATLDARLVALDRRTGAVRWEKVVGDYARGIATNSAPLVVDGKVIVGVSGGEYGIRGFLKAFDADYGYERWTTYTIPGPGEPGHETWESGAWQTGGGPTWQTGAYDPVLKRVYWGVGNPAPWPGDTRPGDNKWTNSLLAIDPDDGRIDWGFQFTPHDTWDYDGNNPIVLADVRLEGRSVPVAMQSNRNGFFYVIDRRDGHFLYAEPTIKGINWTHGIDPGSGRPDVNEAMRPRLGGDEIKVLVPGLSGSGNWFPPAFNPESGVIFLPLNTWGGGIEPFEPDELSYEAGAGYVGATSWTYRRGRYIGHLKAFDVSRRRWLWDVPSRQPMHAGILATAGGLVFTGDQLGFLMALDQRNGRLLWRYQTGSGINASPITYQVGGEQYVAILSGYGGNLTHFYRGPRGGTLQVFALRNLDVDVAGEGEWGPEESPHVVQPAPDCAEPERGGDCDN